jgi:hypothetical protein
LVLEEMTELSEQEYVVVAESPQLTTSALKRGLQVQMI